MYQKIILILFLLNGDLICAHSVADSWILFAKAMRNSWNHCSIETGEWQCLKQSSLEVFDEMTKANVIRLAENVRFIKHRHHRKVSIDDDEAIVKNKVERSSSSIKSWSTHILKDIINLFKTHTLSIGGTSIEGRRRHHNNMMPMMILGVTALGVFTVPLGFQFLLIVCGKAVMLAKMALLISSINGSRRVEHTAAAHYGMYVPNMHNHGHHYWNRGDIEQPRSRRM